MGGLVDALRHIVDLSIDCTNYMDGFSRTKRLDFVTSQPGQYVLRIVLPKNAASAMIGVGGTRISAMQAASQCFVSVDYRKHYDHQIVTLQATRESLLMALGMIVKCFESFSDPHMLVKWGSESALAEYESRVTPPKQDEDAVKCEDRSDCKDGAVKCEDRSDCKVACADRRDRSRSPPQHVHGGAKCEDRSDCKSALAEGCGGSWEERVGGDRSHAVSSAHQRSEIADLEALVCLQKILDAFPSELLDVHVAIACELDCKKISALIGRGGFYVQNVKRLVPGASVDFKEIDQDRTRAEQMIIRGSLINVYRAHALMMKRYHETAAPPWERNE